MIQGLIPDINSMDPEYIDQMLTTGSELLCMLRDGDAESDDPLATELYAKLTTDY